MANFEKVICSPASFTDYVATGMMLNMTLDGYSKKDELVWVMTEDFFNYISRKSNVDVTSDESGVDNYINGIPVVFKGYGLKSYGNIVELKLAKDVVFHKNATIVPRTYTDIPEVKNIMFNGPATIIFWTDGTKTVVRANGEPFDMEKGFAMAFLKKCWGNKADYNDKLRKYLYGDSKEV